MGETRVILVRYWAAARAAAGTAEDQVVVDGPVSVEEVRRRAVDAHPGRRLADVLAACSVLIDDEPLGTRPPADVLVEPGRRVEFLPPFAGG